MSRIKVVENNQESGESPKLGIQGTCGGGSGEAGEPRKSKKAEAG
jgi:hypothetical protein